MNSMSMVDTQWHVFQACALTSHSTGTNLDSYLDALNPLRALPGANALHRNKDLHTNVALPEIGMVGFMNQPAAQRLVDRMFGTPTIKKFQ